MMMLDAISHSTSNGYEKALLRLSVFPPSGKMVNAKDGSIFTSSFTLTVPLPPPSYGHTGLTATPALVLSKSQIAQLLLIMRLKLQATLLSRLEQEAYAEGLAFTMEYRLSLGLQKRPSSPLLWQVLEKTVG